MGIPPKLLKLIRHLHEGAKAQVFLEGMLSEPFELFNGLKQGSVISPILFNIFMGAIMRRVEYQCHSENLGIPFRYQPSAEIFNAQTNRTDDELYMKILFSLFADDLSMFADNGISMQKIINIFQSEADAFGQEVSEIKTELLILGYDPTTEENNVGPRFTVQCKDGTRKDLTISKAFKYLGSRISNKANMNDEITKRKRLMQQAYEKYAAQYFDNKHVSLWQKLLLCNITVVPNRLYACVTWDYNEWHLAQLEAKQIDLLKRLMLQSQNDGFDILQAVRIAKNHHWRHTYPIACHLHSTHIKYLRRLKKLPSTSQLYKIIRGVILSQPINRMNDKEIFAPFYRPIARTLYFMELGEILEQGMQTLHEERNPTQPYANIHHITHPRHWTSTILIPSIKDLTFIIKRFGRSRFMTQFRRELLRLRDQPDQHTNNDVDELDENLIIWRKPSREV
jgi:hypothetical protein